MSEAKPSGLRPPSKIGRPCCTVPPRPAIPPSPSRSALKEMDHPWETHGRRLSEAGVRRGSDNSVVLTEDTDSFIIGDRVWVGGTKPGSIAYIGVTKFAPGEWAGVVLDEPIGKNDGSVSGCRYFQCEPKRGVFSRLTRLTREPLLDSSSALPSGLKSPTTPTDSIKATLNKSVSPSLNASTTSLASTTSQRPDLKIGERVIVSSSQGSKTGVLRYLGTTEFAAGEWCGIELDEPLGKNDGSVDGKRYFECRQKHGLFASVNKVSRSPSSKKSICVVHKPTGAALNSSLRRTGSRESLGSISSFASTTASTNRSISAGLQPPRRPGFRTSTPARITLQESLKEKQLEIEFLRKERDLERERVTKAASQADQAEQSAITIKQEYEKYREEMQKAVHEAETALIKLLDEKNALAIQLDEERRKCEDLLFRFEEESVNKDDIQKEKTEQCVINTLNENKVKELEKQLSEERERVVQLENENVKLFEAEEELARLRNELSATTTQTVADNQDLSQHNEVLQKAKTVLEEQLKEKSALLDDYARQLNELNTKLQEEQEEKAASKKSESLIKNDLEETKKALETKCTVIENLKKEHETIVGTLNDELSRTKEAVDNIAKEKDKERELLESKNRQIIEEQVNLLKNKLQELAIESKTQLEAERALLERLQQESVQEIQKLSQVFSEQSTIKDSKINEILEKLSERNAEYEKSLIELKKQQDLFAEKDNELRVALQKIEDLSQKLNIAENNNVTLTKQINELTANVENNLNVIQDKQKLEDDIAALRTLSSSASAQVDKLNEELKTKEKEIADLRSATAAHIEELTKQFRNEIEDKSKYIEDINVDVSRKSLMLGDLEKEILELKSIILNKDEEIKNLLEKTSELRYTLSLSEDTKKNLESELRGFESNAESLNKKLAVSEEKISQITAQKEKLELDIAHLISSSADSSEQLQKFNQDLRAKEKEADEFRDKTFQLENTLMLNESKLKNAEQEAIKTSDLIKQLNMELENIKEQLEAEKKAKNVLTKEVQEHRNRENELLQSIENNKPIADNLKEKTSQVLQLTKELSTNQEELLDLRQKHENLETSYNQEKLTLEKQLNDMQVALAKAEEESKVLLKTKTKLEADQSASRWSIEELTEKLTLESNQRQKLESIIEEKSLELKQMQEKLLQSQTENDDLLKNKEGVDKHYEKALKDMEVKIDELKSKLNNAVDTIKEKDDVIVQLKTDTELKVAQVSELSNTIQFVKEADKFSRQELARAKKAMSMWEEAVSTTFVEKCSLEKDIKLLKDQLSNAQEELSNKNNVIENIKSEMEALKASHTQSLTKAQDDLQSELQKNKIEIINHVKKVTEIQAEMQSLEAVVESQKSNLDQKERIINDLKQTLKSAQDAQKLKLASDETLKNETLNALQSKVDELQKENEKLSHTKNSVELLLKEREEKFETLQNYIKNKENEAEKNIQNLTERLNSLTSESVQLIDTKNRLEKENKQILAKWSEATNELKLSKENQKNNYNAAAGDAGQRIGDNDIETINLKEEYEMAKNQVDFLNSVIVDMQRKNETLMCKIEVLEMGVPANEADDYTRSTLDKRTAAPRMFCDICDQFDLHETEDCPRQAQDFQEPAKEKISTKKRPVERPYCENCEVFGHDTRNCDDTETF